MSVVRTIALTLALACGAVSVAAAQTPAIVMPDTTAQQSQPHARRPPRGARGMSQRLFKGITLTSAQRTKVDSINQAYATKIKPLVDSMRPAMQQARAARQRGDSTAAAAEWKKTQGTRTQLMSLRKQQMSDIRSVLTPVQQQQLDANVKAMHEGHRARKGGRS